MDQITPAGCRLSIPEWSVLCHLVKDSGFCYFSANPSLGRSVEGTECYWMEKRAEREREMMERKRKRVSINLSLCSQQGKSDEWESRTRKVDLIAPVHHHE